MSTHNDAHGQGGAFDIELARMLELDAEVLAPYLEELTGWLADLAPAAPTRILDLGSGPGTGSLALARRFPAAAVTATDLSPQMLHRLREQAAAHGVADRIDTVEADLDQRWPKPMDGPYDLIWAAAFLHHAAAPGRTLTQSFERLRPGGLLAVTEMDFIPRFLPEDAVPDRPGLESRLHAATNNQPPHEWTKALADAGFTLDERRLFDLRPDHVRTGPALNLYARACLARLRSHADGVLAVDDLAALDVLLDDSQPQSVARRDDLRVQTTRTTWMARRP